MEFVYLVLRTDGAAGTGNTGTSCLLGAKWSDRDTQKPNESRPGSARLAATHTKLGLCLTFQHGCCITESSTAFCRSGAGMAPLETPVAVSASDNDDQDDDGDVCRICRVEGSSEDPLFFPCLCSGSIKYVHQQCLQDWLSHSGNTHCEVRDLLELGCGLPWAILHVCMLPHLRTSLAFTTDAAVQAQFYIHARLRKQRSHNAAMARAACWRGQARGEGHQDGAQGGCPPGTPAWQCSRCSLTDRLTARNSCVARGWCGGCQRCLAAAAAEPLVEAGPVPWAMLRRSGWCLAAGS